MDDRAALDIPPTLLVWVMVLAISIPAVVGGASAIQDLRARQALELHAREIATVAARAYQGASTASSVELSLDLPRGGALSLGGSGSSSELSIVWVKPPKGAVKAVLTSPAVELRGPECSEPLALTSSVRVVVIAFVDRDACSVNFVRVRPG